MPPQPPNSANAPLSDPDSSSPVAVRAAAVVPATTLWPVLKGLGIAVVAVAWALMAHITSASSGPSGWGAALALAPMGFALVLLVWRLPSRWLGGAITAAVAVGLWWLWPTLTGRVALLFYLEHLGVYILLASVFGRSLRGTEESLVTRMARSVHGGVLTPEQEVYTRQVTLAWCLFFVAMGLVSTGLFLWAPVVAWSTFANLLGGPLIALMFAVEYLWRRYALPEEKRTSLADTVRAWKAQRSDKP